MEKVIFGIVALFVMVFGYFIYLEVDYSFTESTEIITIADKYVKTENQRGRFYVTTTDKEVMINKDSLLYFKYDSADLQANIEVGKTYTVVLQGWRWPFMSAYRNIISIEEVQ
jgi:hypothetical protein